MHFHDGRRRLYMLYMYWEIVAVSVMMIKRNKYKVISLPIDPDFNSMLQETEN